MNSNFSYSLFNNFYSDPRAATYTPYVQSYEQPHSFFDEAENQDYTFLPKTSNFLDQFAGSPLDVTRQSTDITEMSEPAGPMYSHKPMPLNPVGNYQKFPQDYNIKLLPPKSAELPSAKQNMYVAVLGAGSGISFKGNGYININTRDYGNQPLSAPAVGKPFPIDIIKKEEHIDEGHTENGRHDFEEEEQPIGQGTIMNAQLRSLLESKIWSAEKDQMLLKLGAQYKCDWKKISKRFNNKKVTPHFLKIRYKELTCAPLQRRVKFNHREDLMIAKYFEKYGSNWAQMATHFNNRTAIMLKNRYYSFIRKRELLDGLLQKVTDYEKDDVKVDDMKDQETETCSDMFTTNKEGGECMNSELMSSSHGANEGDKSVGHEIHESLEEHPIFGYEKAVTMDENKPVETVDKEVIRRNSMEDGDTSGGEDKKEVELLKARVKSLQMLYLRTKSELDLYKHKP